MRTSIEVQRHSPGDPADVTLGPCPGCRLWQLDYTYEAAGTYATLTVETAEALDGSVVRTPRVDPQPFRDVVEDALQEHLEECRHLQNFVEDFLL